MAIGNIFQGIATGIAGGDPLANKRIGIAQQEVDLRRMNLRATLEQQVLENSRLMPIGKLMEAMDLEIAKGKAQAADLDRKVKLQEALDAKLGAGWQADFIAKQLGLGEPEEAEPVVNADTVRGTLFGGQSSVPTSMDPFKLIPQTVSMSAAPAGLQGLEAGLSQDRFAGLGAAARKQQRIADFTIPNPEIVLDTDEDALLKALLDANGIVPGTRAANMIRQQIATRPESGFLEAARRP